MDIQLLRNYLSGLPLGSVRYFDHTNSTNTQAAQWLASGAPDLALVVADEQSAGRGRLGRTWFTPAGAALAFSLALRPTYPPPDLDPDELVARWTALGALAVCQTLQEAYSLPAQIKWPNDVLLDGAKVSGTLVEAQWHEEQLIAAILGIGINVSEPSIPDAATIVFPATCVEKVAGHAIDRWRLLQQVLANLIAWRTQLHLPEFMTAWENQLAFRGEWVQMVTETAGPIRSGSHSIHPSQEVLLEGLDERGRLLVRTHAGKLLRFNNGEIRLLPAPLNR